MATNVDVEYDLFWREVIDCVKRVELNHGLTFEIERGTREASVMWHSLTEPTHVEIRVFEVEPKQPALLVP